MGAARAAHAAGFGRAGAGGFRAVPGRSEYRKLFLEPGRTAMRAFGPFPIAGSDEDFAVALAFFAMKFVNRHDEKMGGKASKLKLQNSEKKARKLTID